VVSIWYLLATSVLTFGQQYLERRFGRGTTRTAPVARFQMLRNAWGMTRREAGVQ
jgi:polar amino acid transport system permease protein